MKSTLDIDGSNNNNSIHVKKYVHEANRLNIMN